MKADNDEDGKFVDVKDMKVKVQNCMADMKKPTSEDTPEGK